MSIARRVSLILLLTSSACWSAPVSAFDGADAAPRDTTDANALTLFKNPSQAFRQGMDGYRSGNFKTSVEAFEYAAANGNPLARWKLGRMYEAGDGVPQDDDKAYRYFSQIVNTYDEEDGDRRDLSVVSNAFVRVGVYSLNGLPRTGVRPDAERAFEMFQYAALNFGNADAQYNLARLYLDGADGAVSKDPRQAARWLALAADKGHLQAQALLGHMLFNGFDGMPPQRAKGLMWLTMARDAALQGKDPKDSWIVDLYAKAVSSATDSDRQVASLYLDEHHKRN
jgi:TPR repeat protein